MQNDTREDDDKAPSRGQDLEPFRRGIMSSDDLVLKLANAIVYCHDRKLRRAEKQ